MVPMETKTAAKNKTVPPLLNQNNGEINKSRSATNYKGSGPHEKEGPLIYYKDIIFP